MQTVEIKSRIDLATDERKELLAHKRFIERLLTASQWLTFLLYLAFALSLYVGNVFKLQDILAQMGGSNLGLGFYVVISIGFAYVLAGTKHAAYTHFSMFKASAWVVLMAVGAGLLAEVYQSSEAQDIKAKHYVSDNAEYSALVNTSPAAAVSVSPALAAEIGQARKNYNRCLDKLARGKEPHCDGDKGTLDGLLESQKAALEAQVSAATANQEANQNRIDKLKHESYNPVIRSAQSVFGFAEVASAISLLMFAVALFFEGAHFHLSMMLKDVRNQLRASAETLAKLQAEYQTISGSEYSDTENKQRFKYQKNTPDIPASASAFVGNNEHPLIDSFFSAFGNKKAPAPTEQQLTNQEKQANAEKWRKALEARNIPFTGHDPAMERDASDETIRTILGDVPASQPVTGQLGIPSKSSGLSSQLQDVADKHYEAWKRAVKSEQITHAKGATQKFIWQVTGMGKSVLSATETARIWTDWLERGCSDKVLKLNPAYKKGNRKPKYIIA